MKASPRVGIKRLTADTFTRMCSSPEQSKDIFSQIYNTAQYKIDGFGARCGFDEQGRFFFETSNSGILYYSADIVKYTATKYKDAPKEKFEKYMKRAMVYVELMETLKEMFSCRGIDCKGEKLFFEVLARDLDEEATDSPTATFVKHQYSKEIFIDDKEKFLLFFHNNREEKNGLFYVAKNSLTPPSVVLIENRVKFQMIEEQFIEQEYFGFTPWELLMSRLRSNLYGNCFESEGVVVYINKKPYKILRQDWIDCAFLSLDIFNENILFPGKFAPLHRGHLEDVIGFVHQHVCELVFTTPRIIPCIIGKCMDDRAEWMDYLTKPLQQIPPYRGFNNPIFSDDAYLPNTILKYQRRTHRIIHGVLCGADRLNDYERMIFGMPDQHRVVYCINRESERKFSGTATRNAIKSDDYLEFVDMVFPDRLGGRDSADDPETFKWFYRLRKILNNK